MRRLVLPEGSLVAGTMTLPDASAHHLRDVLRLREAVQIELTDGAGLVASATVVQVDKRSVVLDVQTPRTEPRPTTQLTLIQCVAKGEKMDTVVRQCTELGVHTIIPVLSERAVPRASQKQDRWRQIAEDAVRVSRRAYRPTIRPVTALADVLAEPRADTSLVFALDGATALREIATKGAIEILIGPEGGLTSAEVAAATTAGFTAVHLGPHTLRTETAAAAVSALLLLGR